MSLIEKAVERLDQLKRAELAPPAGAEPDLPVAERSDASAVNGVSAEIGVIQADMSAPARPDDVAGQDDGLAMKRNPHQVMLDLKRLTQAGMVTPSQPRSVLAEEFRVIKRPLLRNARGKGGVAVDNGNLIMVTSALPGEGKSFTAINLAMSIAMELDHTVLLVDADFSRPSVLSRLGLPPQKGLMDVLVGDISDLSEVILRTNVEKLSILPAGVAHQRATELIASEAMNRMLDELATRYADRIIVFDSPPLLATTEARVLAAHMGQVVVVVESGRTTHGAVRQALATIETCPVKMLVLNKTSQGGRGDLYGYGYGYGYGADARPDSHPEAAA